MFSLELFFCSLPPPLLYERSFVWTSLKKKSDLEEEEEEEEEEELLLLLYCYSATTVVHGVGVVVFVCASSGSIVVVVVDFCHGRRTKGWGDSSSSSAAAETKSRIVGGISRSLFVWVERRRLRWSFHHPRGKKCASKRRRLLAKNEGQKF